MRKRDLPDFPRGFSAFVWHYSLDIPERAEQNALATFPPDRTMPAMSFNAGSIDFSPAFRGAVSTTVARGNGLHGETRT